MFMTEGGSDRSNSARNGRSYAALLSGYKKVHANVFMWDQNWEKPVFISDSGSVNEMTLVTESDFMFDIAQKEIFDFYKVQSTTLSGDDSYSWNPNKARHLFRVYSDKKKDGGRVEVIDRFGNVYSAKVSW
jgi:hypothetical protein